METKPGFFKRNKRVLIILAVIISIVATLGLTLIGFGVFVVVITLLYRYGAISEDSKLGKAAKYFAETNPGKFVSGKYGEIEKLIKSAAIEADYKKKKRDLDIAFDKIFKEYIDDSFNYVNVISYLENMKYIVEGDLQFEESYLLKINALMLKINTKNKKRIEKQEIDK